jgi:hypothetical protein
LRIAAFGEFRILVVAVGTGAASVAAAITVAIFAL